jgi:dTDP-glucose 4,6-dehydratase
VIHNALAGHKIPIYGDGGNIRDWLYVADHCQAIRTVLEKGRVGEVYNIGGNSEKTNLEVVKTICAILDDQVPLRSGQSYDALITFVSDRPGHDRRYAIDASKIRQELGWEPKETFATGLYKTVKWYVENTAWVQNVTTGAYQNWIKTNYGKRK